MRAYAEDSFQMLGVHEKTCKFIAVFVETEEHAETDVVNAALHGSVHRFRVVIVVVFRTRRMEFMIAVFVVCFLEENVGADAGFFQFFVIFHRGRRDIHVDAADIAVFMVDGIDRLDGFEDVFDRIVDRIFSRFDGQSLVSQILQGDDFPADFLLCQLFSRNRPVDCVIRTVGAAVDAVVGEIERCEHDDAVAVEIFFDLLCQSVDLLIFFFDITG